MPVLAHIGGIPVEEWAPFLVPVLALYFWGRRRNRRRDQELQRLPEASKGLNETTTALILARWAETKHPHLTADYVALLYPPGLEGKTAHEVAEQIHGDPASVARQFETLENLGYIELQHKAGEPPRAWLTVNGYDLLDTTETALLTHHQQPATTP